MPPGFGLWVDSGEGASGLGAASVPGVAADSAVGSLWRLWGSGVAEGAGVGVTFRWCDLKRDENQPPPDFLWIGVAEGVGAAFSE
jgi:hypothetical protein